MGLRNLFKSRKSRGLSPEADKTVTKIVAEAFPGGEKQIEEETGRLYRLLGGRLEKGDVRLVLAKSKMLIFISDDKSKNRIVPSIINYSKNKLSKQDAGVVYHALVGYSDKPAIIITASSPETGLEEQVNWVTKKFGMKDKDWKAEQMIQDRAEDGRVFQILDISLTDGSQKSIVFDVTSYAGSL